MRRLCLRLIAVLGLLPTFALLPAQAFQKEKAKQPPVIEPGVPGTPERPGIAPSDATVLFDGKSFAAWQPSGKAKAIAWKRVDGAMEIVPRSGSIRTREAYGFGHYHVEFRTPSVVKGKGQGRGNSGVYIMGRTEVQVLDSYENETYPHGMCGAIYGEHIPLVNACRKPGVWQTFDIMVHPPVVDAAGKIVRRAAFTVLHNGILIHDFAEVNGIKPDMKGPLLLQDHGNPVQFRNIWYRPHQKAIAHK